MNAFVIDNQLLVRLLSFIGILIIMALWEVLTPRRHLTTSKRVRWFTNLSLTCMDAILVRILFPVSATTVASIAVERGWGILAFLSPGGVSAGIISIVILDFAIYGQHVLFHKVPIFWSLHKMHHTDLDIDVTTGARFHPLEIILSMLVKMGVILLVGVPPWAFLMFEALLNGTSMFNHSNVRMALRVDTTVRRFLVTPDMHRVHHSVIILEFNSNFGFNLPWWDRMFGTYRDQPAAGHESMKIGLANYRDPTRLRLLNLLVLPFAGRKGYSWNSR
jgi:sterol desaturase/sphingolipid hydroxylase (fatty acid hydroxylase superfamily)